VQQRETEVLELKGWSCTHPNHENQQQSEPLPKSSAVGHKRKERTGEEGELITLMSAMATKLMTSSSRYSP
jgi:hypothetical protein